jgi:hypothetical protein
MARLVRITEKPAIKDAIAADIWAIKKDRSEDLFSTSKLQMTLRGKKHALC